MDEERLYPALAGGDLDVTDIIGNTMRMPKPQVFVGDALRFGPILARDDIPAALPEFLQRKTVRTPVDLARQQVSIVAHVPEHRAEVMNCHQNNRTTRSSESACHNLIDLAKPSEKDLLAVIAGLTST
jgi:hypothetical protein